MKLASLFLVLAVIASVIMISGCTSDVNRTTYGDYSERSTGNGWQVLLNKNPLIEPATVDNVLTKIEPNSEDTEKGHTNIQTGTKTINGVTVYYKSFTRENGVLEGMLYFEKNGKWYKIEWNDESGNPNKSKIDSEITYYINKV